MYIERMSYEEAMRPSAAWLASRRNVKTAEHVGPFADIIPKIFNELKNTKKLLKETDDPRKRARLERRVRELTTKLETVRRKSYFQDKKTNLDKKVYAKYCESHDVFREKFFEYITGDDISIY